MSNIKVNTDYFGYYGCVRTGYSEQLHTYKVIGSFESNTYCDVPIMAASEPIIHSEIVPCLNVIHCGIDESKVIRVAMKDVFFLKNQNIKDLQAANTDIAALLWLNGNCEYCKYGEKEEYCGASRWKCSLGNGSECIPVWRGPQEA